eukprot:CAMPEP_0116146342 /NCGR_PEP_ID=MMETSP0329-20121206/17113_1 /TAXON_ID=697910 /ORGANISM="Pseudo-nitzschia arenysensis, Strain B593" /LENGTH=535 /DNA_ID=CAMNT_0003642083 /DNA_START=51 /DNA_END=1655 /DNA_ORIENTATION=-
MESSNDEHNDDSATGTSSNSRKRGKLSEWTLRKKKFPPKRKIIVFDASSNIPTQLMFEKDGTHKFVGGIEGKKYLVDNDDFVAMNKVMNEWEPLRLCRRQQTTTPRFITALDALKNFLQVDHQGGSYRIVKIDLSGVMEQTVDTHTGRIHLRNIRVVPSYIGNLSHLQELNLQHTSITQLSPSICRGCKPLKVLNLSNTERLCNLPEEITELSELKELYLRNSAINSIQYHLILSKLEKLEILDLAGTHKLVEIGNGEAGKPANLQILNLRHSYLINNKASFSFPMLHSMIQAPLFCPNALIDLGLAGAKHVKGLEEVVPHTGMLERLDLSFTNVAELPHPSSAIYKRLEHLKVLSLTSTPFLRKYPDKAKRTKRNGEKDDPLDTIVLKRHLPRLGCIGLRTYQTDGFVSHRRVSQALAMNRCRFRLISSILKNDGEDLENNLENNTNEDSSSSKQHQNIPEALWPFLLSNRYIFRAYKKCGDKNCDCQRPLREAGAIFQLLVAYGAEILCNMTTKDEKGMNEHDDRHEKCIIQR